MDYIFVEGNKRDDSTLMQGDLLEKTEFLERVLEQEYVGTNKLLLDSEYFVVLTQSCDLVRRRKTQNLLLLQSPRYNTLNQL